MTEEKHKRGGKNSQFIGKLMQMLNETSNSKILKYDKRRKILIVFSRSKLQSILPLYFKHSSFESFARQLNWYGFRKTRGGYHHVFRHPQLKNGKSIAELKSKRKCQHPKDECIMKSNQEHQPQSLTLQNCQESSKQYLKQDKLLSVNYEFIKDQANNNEFLSYSTSSLFNTVFMVFPLYFTGITD